jgi:hypothetical protein
MSGANFGSLFGTVFNRKLFVADEFGKWHGLMEIT